MTLNKAYTVYLNDQVLEKVYGSSGSFLPNPVNSGNNTTVANAAGTSVIISNDNKATWNDQSKATGLTGSAITDNVYIETGYVNVTSVPGVSYAEAGKAFVIAANTIATTGTGYTYQIGAGDPVYQASNKALRIDGANVTDDITITTNVYRVSGDIGTGDGYVNVGTAYTVAAKATGDQGTGVIYTMGGTTKYVAYAGTTDAATGDIVIDSDYVKVTVTESSDPTDSYKVVTSEDATGLTAAGNTYVKVGSTVTVTNETDSGNDDVYAAIADGANINDAKAKVVNGTPKTVTAEEANITVTITNT